MKLLTVIGTRPEAIKMVPIIKQLEQNDQTQSLVCVTAQHRVMLDQVLSVFDIVPEFDLNVMSNNQTLIGVSTKIMKGLEKVISISKPDAILVHGDTATTFSASMAGFYSNIPILHVEAGLRTYNINSPWPEEAHRQLVSKVTRLHFAPSQSSAQNLYDEHIAPSQVFVTGNTVIDSLFLALDKIKNDKELSKQIQKDFKFLSKNKDKILITMHRRENIGHGIDNIIKAIKKLALQYPNIEFVLPVHLNPKVSQPIHEKLKKMANVFLIEPQDYLPFVWLMNESKIILTDSGGIQEEAPALGIPVLVLRDTTERQEAVTAGTVKLVGTHIQTIVSETSLLLENLKVYKKMAKAVNPYGNGGASRLIVEKTINYLHSPMT